MTALCQCGCGQATLTPNYDDATKGWVKGQARPFVKGHHMKARATFTWYGKVCGEGGSRRYLHRLRAERALGKPLPGKVVVHHADGSKHPNAQLVICQDQAYHMLLHARMRARRHVKPVTFMTPIADVVTK